MVCEDVNWIEPTSQSHANGYICC